MSNAGFCFVQFSQRSKTLDSAGLFGETNAIWKTDLVVQFASDCEYADVAVPDIFDRFWEYG